MKKFLSLLLCVLLCVGALPGTALAAQEEVFYIDEDNHTRTLGGSGPAYQLVTADTQWEDGYYVVNQDTTVESIPLAGSEIVLVLTNQSTLTVTDGIYSEGDESSSLKVYSDGSSCDLLVGSAKGRPIAMDVRGTLILGGVTVVAQGGDTSDDDPNKVLDDRGSVNSAGIRVVYGTLTIAKSDVRGTGGKVTAASGVSYGIGVFGATEAAEIYTSKVTATGGTVVSAATSRNKNGVSYGFYVYSPKPLHLNENTEVTCTGGNVTVSGSSEGAPVGCISVGLCHFQGMVSYEEPFVMDNRTATLNATGGDVSLSLASGENTMGYTCQSVGVVVRDNEWKDGTLNAAHGTATVNTNGAILPENSPNLQTWEYDLYTTEVFPVNDTKMKLTSGVFVGITRPEGYRMIDLLSNGYAYYRRADVTQLVDGSGNTTDVEVVILPHTCSFQQQEEGKLHCACGRDATNEPMPYLDENGDTQLCTSYKVINAESLNEPVHGYWTIGSEWIVVEGTVDAAGRSALVWNGTEADGQINILLKDNSCLKLRMIRGYGSTSIAVYAQSTGCAMGKLEVLGAERSENQSEKTLTFTSLDVNGAVTINGGKISIGNTLHDGGLSEHLYSYGISCGETITVNGGELTASGRDFALTGTVEVETGLMVCSYGATAEALVVNGGKVTLNGGAISGSGALKTGFSGTSAGFEGEDVTVTGGSLTGKGGAVSATGETMDSQYTVASSTGIDAGSVTLSGGKLSAEGGNASASLPDKVNSLAVASSRGLSCVQLLASGGSFSAAHGTAEGNVAMTFELLHSGGENTPAIFESAAAKLGTSFFDNMKVRNGVKPTDLLKSGYAFADEDDTLMTWDEAAAAKNLFGKQIVQCAHPEQTGTCTYCHYTPYTGGGSNTYTPAVTPTTGGTTVISNPSPAAGDTVSVTPTPDSGKRIEQISVTDRNGNRLEVQRSADGSFHFDQPEGDVTITVTYGDAPQLSDVPETAWYAQAVDFAVQYGLMSGTGGGKFEPNSEITRGMFITVLHNLSGKPSSEKISFDDVASGAYYADAVSWAASKGYASGMGNGKFESELPITREQLVVMLWNFSGKPTSTGTLDDFTDGAAVSSWAQAAMRWAIETGILSGKGNGVLDPAGTATRAEAAALLQNYLSK